ncbi:hypothetical protein EF888_01590 [Silicimonas algicola]|uniref:AfsR/SARP family transcriptional regulator n=1 Tax=Silicimonas algicola TaxID=1826607 RepID=UPI000D6C7509|nr:BTAD domain-containing putative transcriptional regulator [Silicimonas algicola]AZQ65933.1 hypothetical protein EF888_01590 [Silicimonas algicola]
MSNLHLSFLGDLRLTDACGKLLATPGPKATAMLACLASSRDLRMGRTALAELVWGDASSTSDARHSLRQCLVRLRSHLGSAAEVLVADASEVWINPDLVSVDFIEAQAAVTTCQSDAIVRHSMEVRGRFCADLDLGSFGFDTWLRARQTECDRLCADLHAKAAEVLSERNEGDAAIAAARRWLELEPFQDEAHATLIALCVRHGRRQAALKAHLACHDLFRKELGVAPAPEVSEALKTRPRPRLRHRGAPSIKPAEPVRIRAWGAFVAGLSAAVLLSQVLGSGRQDSRPDIAPRDISLWVTPASAAPTQGPPRAETTVRPINAYQGISNDTDQTEMHRIPDGSTVLTMLYPVGC